MDVLILCGGSATDLPVQGPKYAALYNIIDSFDTHAHIPEHFADVDAAAKKAGKIGIISCGWDPGMFSLNRVYASAVLPGGTPYTFWGKGIRLWWRSRLLWRMASDCIPSMSCTQRGFLTWVLPSSMR